MSRRPRRLRDCDYRGLHRYSLTICTDRRSLVFVKPSIVNAAIDQIQQSASAHAFAVIAYCFMPDHVHLLVLATSETSDLRAFVQSLKQRTAYHYKQSHAATLWQKGYYEHVLRNDEATLATAKYILENPVRAGLVAKPRDYEFAGSLVLDAEQLDELWQCDAEALRDVGLVGTP